MVYLLILGVVLWFLIKSWKSFIKLILIGFILTFAFFIVESKDIFDSITGSKQNKVEYNTNTYPVQSNSNDSEQVQIEQQENPNVIRISDSAKFTVQDR